MDEALGVFAAFCFGWDAYGYYAGFYGFGGEGHGAEHGVLANVGSG